eukprot:6206553-Pleurochrysis_carterae.AAC.1
MHAHFDARALHCPLPSEPAESVADLRSLLVPCTAQSSERSALERLLCLFDLLPRLVDWPLLLVVRVGGVALVLGLLDHLDHVLVLQHVRQPHTLRRVLHRCAPHHGVVEACTGGGCDNGDTGGGGGRGVDDGGSRVKVGEDADSGISGKTETRDLAKLQGALCSVSKANVERRQARCDQEGEAKTPRPWPNTGPSNA